MASKKAVAHLDWMISMAIFLMFLLSIFVFFKPGAEPAYHKDYLISILEDKLRDETYYSIERMPISGEVTAVEENIQYARFEFLGNFPICGDKNKFRVIDTSFNSVQFDIKSINCAGSSRAGIIDIAYSIPKDTLTKVKFYLLYSKDFLPVGQGVNCIITPQQPGEEKNCVKMPAFTLGVSEIVKGMNSKKLDYDLNIDNEPDGGWLGYIANNYGEELKKEFVYPAAKDFKFCIDNLDDKNCSPNNTIKAIPIDVAVYAKEIKETALKEDTTLGRVYTISLRAW